MFLHRSTDCVVGLYFSVWSYFSGKGFFYFTCTSKCHISNTLCLYTGWQWCHSVNTSCVRRPVQQVFSSNATP